MSFENKILSKLTLLAILFYAILAKLAIDGSSLSREHPVILILNVARVEKDLQNSLPVVQTAHLAEKLRRERRVLQVIEKLVRFVQTFIVSGLHHGLRLVMLVLLVRGVLLSVAV